jgi:outer membrane protein assembly factor BamA
MLLFTFIFSFFTQNQPPQQVDSLLVIQQINITGNQKTKENIILRELDFLVGDSIKKEDIEKRIDLNKRKLVNTNLFITVEVNYIQNADNQIVINVKLLEQWYVLGYPIFQISDRNYAEWFQRGADFRRTTYGIDLIHSNFRGRAERINLRLETGFTQRIDVGYRIPYIDKAMKTGAGFSLSYITNKTLAFRSLNDTLNYVRNLNEILRRRFSGAVYLKKRYHFYDNHTLELRYNNNSISDTIRKLNPDYFLDNRTIQKYLQLSYYL